ncbi:MAG TPA: M67 family metallopeptidase [Nitrospirota bacterium]|nr:M67 family metallopeptidase [Nitrospirota bacterium]
MRNGECGMGNEKLRTACVFYSAFRIGSSMLIFKKSDMQAVLNHCIAGFPNEACGILGGTGGRVEKVYPMINAKPGPAYYEMDPEEQFRVLKDIRRAGLAMVGVFHSHPAGQAYPSRVDVEKAYWPGTQLPNYPDTVQVIISLLDPAAPVAKGYSLLEGTISEVPLSVE